MRTQYELELRVVLTSYVALGLSLINLGIIVFFTYGILHAGWIK